MIEKILKEKNLQKAAQQVINNKGAAGVDGITYQQLSGVISQDKSTIITSILTQTYVPTPIKGVEIPKTNGKTRLLGIPTVIDRWLQQAVSQQLVSKFEPHFEAESFGFRPNKSIHQAVHQSLSLINQGYQDIVDIDLKAFFAAAARMRLTIVFYYNLSMIR